MKKLLIIFVLGVLFTSCQKEYTCECTFYWSDGTVGNTTSQTIKGSKEDAQQECSDKSNAQVSGSNYKICHLK
jgi:hypothetical protein